MPGTSNLRRRSRSLRRAGQITESHCGPAVLQMLLSRLGVYATQERLAELAGAAESIDEHGTRIDQLALAVKRAAPEMRFWYKDHATLEDLITLVSRYRIPTGVEWQGVFGEDEEDEDDDQGHYSIVVRLNQRKRQLTIVDPYADYIFQNRVFSFDTFLPRWWDTNLVTDPETGEARVVEDYHMLFIVTLEDAAFPLSLGMQMAE